MSKGTTSWCMRRAAHLTSGQRWRAKLAPQRQRERFGIVRALQPSVPSRASATAMLQPIAVGHKSLADYTHLVGRPLVEEIRELAEPLKGKRVLHLSATAFGGGVSEILYTLVPLMRDVGLEAEWQVIYGREEFFNATKLHAQRAPGQPAGPHRRGVGDLARATTR